MSNEYALNESINHPRRSLGNRYRTQALKFLELVDENELNLQWAEKNARQRVRVWFGARRLSRLRVLAHAGRRIGPNPFIGEFSARR